MVKDKKKPLTHWKCVRSYYAWLKLIFAIPLICIPIITIIASIPSVAFYDLNIFAWLIIISLFIFMMVLGFELLINVFKFQIAMTKKQYFVYLSTVSDKKNGDSDDMGSTYYLHFKKNRYKKQVSKKEYELAQIGSPYYLVKIIGEKEAFSAFAESEYYLHHSVQKQFKQVDKNEFN